MLNPLHSVSKHKFEFFTIRVLILLTVLITLQVYFLSLLQNDFRYPKHANDMQNILIRLKQEHIYCHKKWKFSSETSFIGFSMFKLS